MPNRRRGRSLASLATFALCSVAVSLLAPATAGAQGLVFNLPWLGPTSYSFTDTTLVTYRYNNLDNNQFDDNLLAFTERFDSALTAPPWRLQLRIDGFLPLEFRPLPSTSNPFYVQGSSGSPYTSCLTRYCTDYLRPDLRIERVALRYQHGIVTAELGDVYTVIGRGVAIAFRKIDPLGLDTALRGGRFELDGDRVSFRAFGGYANPQNLDPITLQVNHDYGDALAGSLGTSTLRPGPDILGGAEAAVRLGPDEDVELGLHALHLHAMDSQGTDYDVTVAGYRAQAPALLDGALALHGEVDALRRMTTNFMTVRPDYHRGDEIGTNIEFGRAVYGAAQYTHGDWNVLAEWKDYQNYLLSPSGAADPTARRVYSAAPSLERDDVILRSNSDARGGRVRVEHLFRPGPWSASLTMLVEGQSESGRDDAWGPNAYGAAHGYVIIRRRARPMPPAPGATPGQSESAAGGAGPVGSAVTGALGGARVPAGDWQVTASAGFRHEWLLGAPHVLTGGGMSDDDWDTAHADMDLAFAITPNDSLETRIDARFEHRWNTTINPLAMGDYYNYVRSGITVTWAHGERLSVSGVLRYDNFYYLQGVNTPTVDQPSGVITREPYPQWYPAGEIRYMFYPGSTLRLFGGMTPGGRLCTGGVCRDVPPFQGALLELVLRI